MASIAEQKAQETKIGRFLAAFQEEHKVILADAKSKHLAICATCREGQTPDVDAGEIKFGVKIRASREFVHVIACSKAGALARLGLMEEDIAYMVAADVPQEKGKMPAHIKKRLKELNKQRRIERRHMRELQAQKHGVIDTLGTACYTHKGSHSNVNKKGGDNMAKQETETLATWVRDFIEGQITVKEDGKDVVDVKLIFDLAKENGVEAEKLSRYRKELKPETAGRVRMTVGNMIRGAASKNGKLITLGGGTKTVPEALLPVKKEKVKAEKKGKTKTKKAA